MTAIPMKRLHLGELVYFRSRRMQVVRVNECAAWLKEYRPPEIVTIAGAEYEMAGEPVGPAIDVSAHAFLERAEAGEERF